MRPSPPAPRRQLAARRHRRSGDGDTASIGHRQFVALVRRKLPLIYIVEDNGVYGLTKGQSRRRGRRRREAEERRRNDFVPIDCCSLAIELGGTFGRAVLSRAT